MNEQVKQRLVGAVVLVSLAVIFIPMLLDVSDNSSMSRFGSNIPEQPEFNFQPLEIPLQPVAPPPETRPRVIDKAEEVEEAQPQPATAPVTPASAEPKPVKTQDEGVVVAEQKPHSGGDARSWVVQVGSFGQSANALALRDKLRSAGFSAYVEKYRDRGTTSYRVRVGPELERATADRHQSELERKFKLKGIVLGNP